MEINYKNIIFFYLSLIKKVTFTIVFLHKFIFLLSMELTNFNSVYLEYLYVV